MSETATLEAEEELLVEGAHEHHHEHEHDHDVCCCDHGHEGGRHHHDHHDGCCCGHGHDHDHEHVVDDHVLEGTPTFTYHVTGLDCPSCALGTQNAVRMLQQVSDAKLTYVTATLEVVAKEGASDDDVRRQVLECVRSRGQDLELTAEEAERLDAKRPWLVEHREQVLMGASGVMLAVGLVLDHVLGNEAVAIPFYVAAAICGLVFIAPMAVASLRRRTADMNVLMGIAVIGGLVMGFAGDTSTFGDAAIVIFLDQVGEWLEGWSMRKTASSIEGLADLAPDDAHLLATDGTTSDVAVGSVEEGQRIRILPGERVPLDGVIITGASSFNEAAITGESVPRDKGVGDEVFAGSLNTQGTVDIEVTADEDCTTLARIVSMVQGAQAAKAPYESFVDRFAALYTPIVVVGAIVVGVGVPLVLTLVNGLSATVWHDWVYRALSLLVVACPCALVISTPVSFVSALTRAAKNGVLVKGGAYFDVASHIDTVAFDKTGTLTSGSPSVTEVACAGDAGEKDVLALAAALERNSTHPLARAIVQRAEEEGLAVPEATSVEEIAANGMRGIVAGEVVTVGKLAFTRAGATVGTDVEEAAERLGKTGATALVVTRAGQVAGVIGVADTIRPTTPDAMRELRGTGVVRSLLMLTGDNAHAAEHVAREAGVTDVAAELLPDGKVAHIDELKAQGAKVAMVGDGINDAPALATADLGITMGAAASDTALEVADVALLSDDLSALPGFFRLAVRTMHIASENIAFAIAVKALVFVLVIAGVAGMGAAVFADTGVALIVILNGMRLMLDSRLAW